MLHLVVDGYNFIHRIRRGPQTMIADLDMLRREVLERLFRYKRDRGVKITAVFDARGACTLGRQRENYKGVEVVYAGEGETADDVIIGWIRERRSGQLVVSSDRAIIDEAKKAGIPFMTPVALAQSMVAVTYDSGIKGNEENHLHREKRGNPRKLPKKLRKVVKSIHKIK